ncbi:MAG: efflux RND transporter periplasmic adaptor subunit [Planctomycetota bacterium]
MKAKLEKLLHYAVLIVVTLVAGWVMWFLSSKEKGSDLAAQEPRPLALVAQQKAPVELLPVSVRQCEIVSTFAGKIRPWETYQIAFEVPGRVQALGTGHRGQELDEGDRVEAGQVLARLDDRVYRAQKSEAAARIELAQSELKRAEEANRNSRTAVSETQVQQFITDLALAKAQHEVAIKNLDDATLEAPVAAAISRRMIKTGESVNAHQMVFELVENDRVLLVVDVPESQVRELENRDRELREQRADPGGAAEFVAHVRMEGRDRFGRPWPAVDGRVHHIAEVADERTGLFQVEIELDNRDGMLRPGMVATADIVTGVVPGYTVPDAAVIFRGREAHLFTVDREPADMEVLYWQLGTTEIHRARRVPLRQWVDLGETVIIPAEDIQIDSVIVRGQYRLADGQIVRPINGAVDGRVDVAEGVN